MTAHIDIPTHEAHMPGPDLATLAASGAHPSWAVLDAARAANFTGEIAFDVTPVTSVYFDNGVPYHAVRTGDPSLCDRLIETQIVEPAQIERGVVRVGNVENLGRLFDRDPSIDKDAVMVVMEMATDEVVASVANSGVHTFRMTPYRHHASGVHRWFVAPDDPTQLSPIGAVAQLDTSVTTDLPAVSAPLDDEDVKIEWSQPVPSAPLHTLDDAMVNAIVDADQGADTSHDFDPDQADWSEPSSVVQPLADTEAAEAAELTAAPQLDDPNAAASTDVDEVTPVSSFDDDFQIVWPDGSEQLLAAADETPITPDITVPEAVAVTDAPDVTDIADITEIADAPVTDVDEAAVTAAAAPLTIEPQTVEPPPAPASEATVEPSAAPMSFEMPPLALSDDDQPDDHQPDEVVDAVRRALAAIESVGTSPTTLPAVAVGDLPAFSFDPIDLDADVAPDPSMVAPVDAAALAESPAPSADLIDPGTRRSAVQDEALALALALGDADDEPATVTVAPLDAVTAPTTAGEVDEPETVTIDVALEAEAHVEPLVTAIADAAAPAPAFNGFAPPTMNDSAEAVYARAAEVGPAAAPASGVASVVFVDEEETDDHARSGALRRLIGSLRRK